MFCRLWFATFLISLLSASPSLTSQGKRAPRAGSPNADCGPNSDVRYEVCRGPWSGKTVSLFNTWAASDTNLERRLRLLAPDGRKLIRVAGFHVRLRMRDKWYWTPFGNMHDAEVGWAPDSRRLFVTWSETGELGLWHVQVYDVVDGRGLVEVKDVTREASADILRRERRAPIPKWVTRSYRSLWDSLMYCSPDMIGSRWLNGSKEILVAARTGPDSGCKYMADVVAYRLDATTGKILQVYQLREAHRVFGDDDLPKLLDDGEDLP